MDADCKPVKDGEIVGLRDDGYDKSCCSHDCCGAALCPDDLVRFRLSYVEIDGVGQDGIKAILVKDGTELCTVGYVPRKVFKKRREDYKAKFAQIIELYDYSESSSRRRRSAQCNGIASFRLLEHIPIFE